MATVDIMIVGSQKSGTSSLLTYLGAHPGILPQQRREMTWFTDSALAAKPFPDTFYFDGQTANGLVRLGKLSGLMYDPGAVARLVETSPSVTVVAILREPVSRAYASYWFAQRRGRESSDRFEDAVAAGLARIESDPDWEESGCRYLDWSCYAPHLQRLRHHVGDTRLHLLILEELLADPRSGVAPVLGPFGLDADALAPTVPWENSGGTARSAALARARRWGGRLDLAKRLLPPEMRETLRRHYRRFNETEAPLPPIDPGTERRLRAAFKRPNDRLAELLGRSLDAWSPRS